MLPNQARYQLRYIPIFFFIVVLTGLGHLAALTRPQRVIHYLQHLIPNRLACKASRIPTALHPEMFFCNKDIITVFCGKVKPFEKFFCNVGRSGLLLPFFGLFFPIGFFLGFVGIKDA